MAASSVPQIYDEIGSRYGDYRRADARWANRINAALGDARSILNVGAGAGSYEPHDRFTIAVEPSQVMIEQRPLGSAPAIRGAAESLPFREQSFDAALALMTVHHWRDAAQGLAELRRVSRRQVVFTWDPALFARRMWFVDEYLPEVFAHESQLATLETIVTHLGSARVEALAVPADCTDGVLGAYWRRPRALLDPRVRSAISGVALLDPHVVATAIARLRGDVESGLWNASHESLLDIGELDLGYRLVIAGDEIG